MNRIFPTLALFAVVFMAATLVLGLSLGDLNKDATPQTLRWATVHRLSGIAAALAVVFVDSIVVTYFIGTSRWCKEVADAYKLEPRYVQQAAALKRRTFPLAVVSMLTMVGVAALGGAADPAAALRLQPLAGFTWSNIHLAGALAGLCLIIWIFYRQWINLLANQELINQVQAEVRRIRIEKGLDV